LPHLDEKDAYALVSRRHLEWEEHQAHWRFLFDSYEGGNRYKSADYYYDPAAPQNLQFGISPQSPWYRRTGSLDRTTAQPDRFVYGEISECNLIPHLSETGTAGRDLYALRIARTPIPPLVERNTGAHLSRIFSQEVRRAGPKPVEAWWADVDGKGTPMDRWVQETAGPLLLVLGQLDVLMDRPRAPEGVVIRNKADEAEHGLDACVASVVLPENVLWWELDSRGSEYAEALILERCRGRTWFRHLTPTDSNAYSVRGEWIPSESREHRYNRVPMVRVFDQRKTRCSNVGMGRYEPIAEIQKAVYNLRSELILSDVQQSHALLMGPEDFVQGEDAIPVGPDGVLPMKKSQSGSTVSYQGWAYLDPPKGAQQEVRQHIMDLLDEADRVGGLAKPPGMSGGTVTAQSGVSKIMDSQDGNALLGRDSAALQAAEHAWVDLACDVLGLAEPEEGAVTVTYPRQFELYTAADLAQALTDIQMITQGAGAVPKLQGELLNRLVGVLLPGLADDKLDELKDEIDGFLDMASKELRPKPEEPDDEPPLTDESLVQGVSAVPA
jgi:hypothetical protein